MAICPSCGFYKENSDVLEKFVSPFNNQEYKLYHCLKCDLQWWEPLKMVPEFYEKSGVEFYETFHEGVDRTLPYYQKEFLKKIQKFVEKPYSELKLLDIGCGDGLFLKRAEEKGFEVYGIDLDKNSVKVANKKLSRGKVYNFSLKDFIDFAKEKGLKFDIITFFEVLEHQDNPLGFLEDVKSLLKPHGLIAGSVPNRESFFQRLNRVLNPQLDAPPHHFLRFSKKSLYNLFHRGGFRNIYISVPHTPLEYATYLVGKVLKSKITSPKKSSNTGSKVSKKETQNFSVKIAKVILTPFVIPLYIKPNSGMHIMFFVY